MATAQNFSVYAGDSEPLAMSLTGYDNITAINLTGAVEILVNFKRVLSDPDAVARIVKKLSMGGVTIVDAANGKIAVQLLPADTAGVQAQLSLEYTAKVFFSGTNQITGAKGQLTVLTTDVQTT